MKKTANLFLVLFLLTAVISLAAELLQAFTPFRFPLLLTQLIWNACGLCAVLLYLGYGFNRHLPVLILLPLQTWCLWKLLDFWPLENVIGPHYLFYASVAQLLLALIVLQFNKVINGQGQFLTDKQFAGPSFQGRRFLKFLLLNILLFPILLTLGGFALVSNLIENASAGFVQLKPNGLYMIERTYRRNDKQIQMMGMIHLARPQYYTDLAASIPPHRTLILMEGVTDKDRLLNQQFSYAGIADVLGLTSQRRSHFQGRQISLKDLNSPIANDHQAIDLLPADIDLSRFDPLTIKVLNALAKHVLGAERPLEGYRKFSRWAEQNLDSDFDETVMNDLIDKRNRHLLSLLPMALKKYDHLVIPWGALHMKELEQAILQQGFIETASRKHLSIDFLLLPFGRLWKQLVDETGSAPSRTAR